jgi:MFS family permease
LLTVGSLSDYIGRRPAILAALALNVAAMIMFISADSAATLIVARIVQGFCHGPRHRNARRRDHGHRPRRGPVLNSITPSSA